MTESRFYPFPEVITDRLILRRLVQADAETLFAYQSDKRNFPHVDMQVYSLPAEAAEYVRKMNLGIDEGSWLIWAVADRISNDAMGTVSIWNIDWETGVAELGYGLFPAFRGRGLASEAVSAASRYGFTNLHLRRLEAFTAQENSPSRRMLERAGFRYDRAFAGDLEMVVYTLEP